VSRTRDSLMNLLRLQEQHLFRTRIRMHVAARAAVCGLQILIRLSSLPEPNSNMRGMPALTASWIHARSAIYRWMLVRSILKRSSEIFSIMDRQERSIDTTARKSGVLCQSFIIRNYLGLVWDILRRNLVST